MTKRIFLIGYMGSGKTTVGKMLAERLNYSFIDIDRRIEDKTRQTVYQFFEKEGEDTFRLIEHESLKEAAQMKNVVISTGGGVPCFHNNMDIILTFGTSFYLQWTIEELLLRLEIDGLHKRPLLADKNEDELLLFISDSLSVRENYYKKANFMIHGDSDAKMVNQIIGFL